MNFSDILRDPAYNLLFILSCVCALTKSIEQSSSWEADSG